mmetsp:Transcript_32932/g.104380  ORF Transcript_32932/g.104380 Transcript_32932/m.104380 type:complete len:262 (-) Transcript_32932:846-1631(-)
MAGALALAALWAIPAQTIAPTIAMAGAHARRAFVCVLQASRAMTAPYRLAAADTAVVTTSSAHASACPAGWGRSAKWKWSAKTRAAARTGAASRADVSATRAGAARHAPSRQRSVALARQRALATVLLAFVCAEPHRARAAILLLGGSRCFDVLPQSSPEPSRSHCWGASRAPEALGGWRRTGAGAMCCSSSKALVPTCRQHQIATARMGGGMTRLQHAFAGRRGTARGVRRCTAQTGTRSSACRTAAATASALPASASAR